MDKIYVKKGTFVRWTADRLFKSWDTYGIITKVTKTKVTIKTFDDFEETELNINGEAMTDEVRWASKEEVESYIESRKLDLAHLIKKLEVEHKKEISRMTKQIENLEKFVK